jgi:RNA polymerase sigma-70 factor (ECF subfamily)
MGQTDDGQAAFLRFARAAEPSLRVALVAGHGAERGSEATNDALLYAWQNWDRVRGLDNPVGYLYRVGQRSARHRRRQPRADPVLPDGGPPWVEPELSPALESLSQRQREVVTLVGAYQWSIREAASLLGLRPSSVQTHFERGMRRLRDALGVEVNEGARRHE